MQPITSNRLTENAKQVLHRVHHAYVHAQLDHGLMHIADVRRDMLYCEASDIVRACTVVALRAEHDMAIALALGDASVPRLDELVLSQVRELFGEDMERAVRARIVELDARWPANDIAPWPFPLSPRPTVQRAPWYLRAAAWLLRGRS